MVTENLTDIIYNAAISGVVPEYPTDRQFWFFSVHSAISRLNRVYDREETKARLKKILPETKHGLI